jgi:putative ABC transport system substrate-binding protein
VAAGDLIVVEETERRCAQMGLRCTRLPLRNAEDDAKAVAAAGREHLEALFVMDDGAATKRRLHILDLALARRVPVVSIYRDFADAGALFAYGPSLPAVYRRGGYFVDRLLKGIPPGDLPVEHPTNYKARGCQRTRIGNAGFLEQRRDLRIGGGIAGVPGQVGQQQ